MSVLLVDGDAQSSARTEAMLRALGVRDVVVAGSASSARAEATCKSFDVLICSFRSGVEQDVLRAIRDVSPRTRSILISAYAAATRMLARNLGAAEVLETPFDVGALELVLRRVFEHTRGLYGEVQELSLVDLLQMYHHSRQSIAISLSGPIPGRVRLSKGEIVHAESGALRGQAALSVLLGAETGVISTELSPPDQETSIQGSFHSLVLGAITEHDERRHTLAPSSAQDVDAATLSFAAGSLPQASTMHELDVGEYTDVARPQLRGSALAQRFRRRAVLVAAALALVLAGIYFALGSRARDADARAGDRAPSRNGSAAAPAEPAGNSALEVEIQAARAPVPSASASSTPGAVAAPMTSAPAPEPSVPARAARPVVRPRPASPPRQPLGAGPPLPDEDDLDIRPRR